MAQADIDRLQTRVIGDYQGFGYVTTFFGGDLDAAASLFNDSATNTNSAIATSTTAQSRANLTLEYENQARNSSAIGAAIPPIKRKSTTSVNISDHAIWSFTRSTPTWGFNSVGLLAETAIDNLLWEFEQTSRAPKGVTFAGARTNSFTNPRAEGAVAGTPGTRPTGWGVLPTGAPTIQSLGTTTRNGVPGVLYRFSGVPTTTAVQAWDLQASIVVGGGSTICTAIFVELTAGSLTNVSTFNLRNNAADTGTTFTPGAFARVSNVWVATDTSTNPIIRWSYLNTSTSVDFTIFIGGVTQETEVRFVSSVILPPVGTPGVSTRAQGSANIPITNLGPNYNYWQGTLIVEWSSQPGPFLSFVGPDWFGIISLGDLSADNVMGAVISPAHNFVSFRRTVGGVVQTSADLIITPPAAGLSIKVAFSWHVKAGAMQIAARGAFGTILSGQVLVPAITHVMPGRFSTSLPLFGSISALEIRPFATFNSALAALT